MNINNTDLSLLFQMLESRPKVSKKEAFKRITSIVRPLTKNKEHMKAFERYIVLQDLIHDVEETELFANKELPWGYNTIDEIKQDMRNVRYYVLSTPAVLSAIRQRHAMMKDIKLQLVDAGLLKDNGNENYFHHQVLQFMDNRANVGVSAKDIRNHKEGWQRSKTGSIPLYNTNYFESEFEVIAQSIETLAIKGVLNNIRAVVDIIPILVARSNNEGGKWQDYIPKGYVRWYPKIGTIAYRAATEAEQAVQNIMEWPNREELSKMIAEANKSMWVIPENIAKQLDTMYLNKDSRTKIGNKEIRKLTKPKRANRKLLWALLIYILVISSYVAISTSTIQDWRQTNIVHSPKVYITSNGEKYHREYHYYGRTSSITLFEAGEKGYNPCRVCSPPLVPAYPGKPKFYFYNWFLMSAGISLIYWTVLIKKL